MSRPSWRAGSLAIVLVAASGIGAQTQQPAPAAGTGLILGRVVDARDNAPVAGAVVTLTGAGTPRRAIVDGQGRFLFAELPAGAFTLTAAKSRFLEGGFGKLRPDGTGRSIDLRDGERVTDAVVKMWRLAAISGMVTDEAGEPIGSAGVRALRRAVTAGRWSLVSAGSVPTDERGVYRLGSLPPGDYMLGMTSYAWSLPASAAASTDARRQTGDPGGEYNLELQSKSAFVLMDLYTGLPVTRVDDLLIHVGGGAPAIPTPATISALSLYSAAWFAGAASPSQASVVTVRSGDERSGIDLHLKLAPAVRISGTVIGPAGPIGNLGLYLMPGGLDDVAVETGFYEGVTATAEDGTFTFVAHAGQYTIRAVTVPRPVVVDPATRVTMVSPDQVLWVSAPVSVGETNVSGLQVSARAGLRVTGRVEFDGAAARPTGDELRAIRVAIEPADGRLIATPQAYQAQLDQNGAFYTGGLIAGRYFLRVPAAVRGWTLKSAVVAGRDVSDVPLTLDANDVDGLVLTFTDRPSNLAGTVRTAQGAPDPDAAVLIFPADPSAWKDVGASPRRLRSVRPARSGAYQVIGLPAGDYLAVAVSDAAASNWQDPAFLQRLAPAAARVRVDEERVTLDLTTKAIR